MDGRNSSLDPAGELTALAQTPRSIMGSYTSKREGSYGREGEESGTPLFGRKLRHWL